VRKTAKLVWGCAIAGSLAAGGPARADFTISAEASGEVVQDASVTATPVTWDDLKEATSFPDAASELVADGQGANGGGQASSHASATFGELTASAGASDGDDPNLYPQASAAGVGESQVYDFVHVGSATLAPGTPVDLDVALHLMANTSTGQGTGYDSTVRALLDLVGPTDNVHLAYINLDPPISTQVDTMQAKVGETLALSYSVRAHAFVAATAGGATFGGLSIRPRINAHGANPDVSFTTDSGYDYGLPVPEPDREAAGALALIGLACARRFTRR